MEMIYISHPYSGNEKENRKAANQLTKKLSKKYPHVTFINPISAMVHFKDSTTAYEAILEHCKHLMSKCDGVIMAGNWQESYGCTEEHKLATELKMDIWDSVEAFVNERTMPNDCRGKHSYCKKCLCLDCLERLECWNCNDCEECPGKKYPIGFTGLCEWDCSRYRSRTK